MNQLIVGRSKFGKGLFAGKLFKKHTKVTAYLGILIDRPKYKASTRSRYFMSYDKTYVLDGEIPCNLARFINHSFTPNVEAADDGEGGIGIYALCNIKIGEELFMDYGYTRKEIVNDPEYSWYRNLNER